MYIEIVGPIPNGSGKFIWMVYIFDKNGKRIGEFEALSKNEAILYKDQLATVFINERNKES